jgi:hypothetical protein
MRHLVVLTVLVVAGLLSQAQTKSQNRLTAGEIKGTVTDQDGTPVSDAVVYAVPQGLILSDITPPSVKSDADGAFNFHGLDFEAYKLYARKAGEPDPFDCFYADAPAKAPRVDLSKDHPRATIKVKLAPQAGVISGRIIDASTGSAVKAYLGFMDAEGHGHSVFADGSYRILVPPGKDVTLMVTPTEPSYGHSQVPVAPLRLEPGQFVNLDIPISN